MSANVNHEIEKGGDQVVIVREGEDLDAVAAMASGVAQDPGGGARYVPLDEITSHDFHAFAETVVDESEVRTWTNRVTEPVDEDDETVGPQVAAAAIEDPDSEEGAAHLRAQREADARRRRRARDGGALATREGGGVAAQAGESTGMAANIKSVTAPGGRMNRRLVYFLLVAVAVVAFLVLKGNSNKAKEADAKNAAGQTQPAPGQGDGRRDSTSMRVGAPSDGTLRSPEGVMGSRGAEGHSGDASVAALGMGTSAEPPAHNLLGAPTTGAQPAAFVTTGSQASAARGATAVRDNSGYGATASEPVSPPYAAAGYGSGGDGFSFKMRGVDANARQGESASVAAQERASETTTAARSNDRQEGRQRKTETGGLRLPVGTRIPMTLLEPLQSGIETTASARVDAEIRDAKGEVLLRPGTIITIPFLAAHANGRMMNAAGEGIEVQTASGATLVLVGAVKGVDGLVGIPGRVTKSGQGSTIGRVVRGVTRIGVRQAGAALPAGGMAGDIERETDDITGINGAVAGRYGVSGGQREVVNVPASVRFTFVTGK